MDTLHFKELLDRYLSGTPGKEDLAALRRLLDDPVHLKELEQIMDSQLASPLNGKQQELGAVVHRIKKAIEQQIISRGVSVHRVHFLRTSWFRYAAAVVLLVGGAVVLRLAQDDKNRVQDDVAVVQNADIAPGNNKAVLTVGGKKIDLASNKTGIAVGSTVTYTDGSEVLNLVQHDGGGGAQDDGALGGVRQMELRTPRGGQYQALLPDGSKVWLNAASSIRFPSKFNGNTREVEVSGEVYLEIAKDATKSFKAHVASPVSGMEETTVEVLGTHFNINGYGDEESVKTTLIEGRVRVVNRGTANVNLQSVIITPGQQALAKQSGIKVIEKADVSAALAWKNGYFKFTDASIQDVMRQLARWYDLEVVFEGKISEDHFEGKIPRNAMISQVLSVLEKNQVHFRIDGKRIVVTK